MDLRRGEVALARLENAVANVAAVGVLRQDLETLNSTLTDTAVSLGALSQQLNEASASYQGTSDSVRNTLKELQTGLDKLASDIEERVTKQIGAATTQYATLLRSEVRNVARDVEERVRNQVSSATTEFASLVRAETRSIVDRIELNQREDKQLLEQGFATVSAIVEAKSAALEARQRRHSKWLVFAIFIAALSVAISVRLALSH